MSIDPRELLWVAYKCAEKSPDPSTQTASLLVDEDGSILLFDVNRFPDGVKETPKRYERPLKYKFAECSERNVIYAATREGIRTKGLTIVCSWVPCTNCARAIIQSGIKCLITHKRAHNITPDRWKEDIGISLGMLAEVGIEIVMFDKTIGAPPILYNGELWHP